MEGLPPDGWIDKIDGGHVLSDEPAASFDLPIRPEDLSSVDGGWFTFFFRMRADVGCGRRSFCCPTHWTCEKSRQGRRRGVKAKDVKGKRTHLIRLK